MAAPTEKRSTARKAHGRKSATSAHQASSKARTARRPADAKSEKSAPPLHVVRLKAGETLKRIVGGWKTRGDPVVVRVKDAHLERGTIRATLSVHDGETVLYRDVTNLTSASSRARVINALRSRGIGLDEGLLLAFDEASRRPRPNKTDSKGRDKPPDVSDAPPIPLKQLRRVFGRWLLITDDAYLLVFVGVVLAHRLAGDPVWLLIVAPPGATKTELLRALYGYPGIYPLSSLTARTLASGLDVPEGDQSLLARLTTEILVLKDFTTVLEMHREERQAVLAQLREVYDGQFDKVWGTGRELHWSGHLGFLAGVTPVIDSHHGAMAVLGERFVLFRTDVPERHALGLRALEMSGRESTMRRELARAMHGFLNGCGADPPGISDTVNETLAAVADFTSRARSAVIRDSHTRSFQYAPPPEAPTRLAKVFAQLARGIALACDHDEVGDSELQLVLRVALDSLPIARRAVIATLHAAHVAQTTDAVAQSTAGFSRSLVQRTLEDLQALEVVYKVAGDTRGAVGWRLRKRWRTVFEEIDSAAEASTATPPDVSGQHTDSPVRDRRRRGGM